jgi:hypothetical protein
MRGLKSVFESLAPENLPEFPAQLSWRAGVKFRFE